MNALMYAIGTVKASIPIEILEEGFKDKYSHFNRSPTSLDNRMLMKCIRPRILMDCGIVGSRTMMVGLDNTPYDMEDNNTRVYYLRPEDLNYQRLISVLSVSYGLRTGAGGMGGGNLPGSDVQGGCCGGPNELLSSGRQVMDSMSNIPTVSTASVELVNDNTVLIRDNKFFSHSYYLRCIIENDDNMNNINPRSYTNFGQLCKHGVMSYLYNKLIIEIDRGKIEMGKNLGIFRDIVQEYSESENDYQDYLNNVWRKVAFQNDNLSHNRFLSMQLGGTF